MRRMRANIVNASHLAGTWSCTTTVIAWLFDSKADPVVRCPLEQLDTWSQVWANDKPSGRNEARGTWMAALRRLTTEGNMNYT